MQRASEIVLRNQRGFDVNKRTEYSRLMEDFFNINILIFNIFYIYVFNININIFNININIFQYMTREREPSIHLVMESLHEANAMTRDRTTY